MLFSLPSALLAIGEISLGFCTGITRDPNNIEYTISRYNTAFKAYEETNAGAKSEQLSVQTVPLMGAVIRYQFNYLLFRFGSHYAKAMFSNKGGVTATGGIENEVKVTTYQNTFPLSMAIILPLKEKTYFYLGGGLSYHQSYVKITQSNPGQVAAEFGAYGLSTNRRDRYSVDFVGYHFIFGIEIPVVRNLTLSTEWIHQDGRSHPLTNGGVDATGSDTTAPVRTMSARGDFILFGINYYLNI